MFLSNGFRLVCQALYFFLTAKALGASGYGILVAVLSTLSLFAPFVGWGSGTLLIKRSATHPEAHNAVLPTSILTHLGSFIPISILALISACLIFRQVDRLSIALFILSELLLARLVLLFGQSCQARGHFGKMALIDTTYYLFRIMTVLLLIQSGREVSMGSLALAHLISAAVTSVAAFLLIEPRVLDWRSGAVRGLPFREGGLYSMNQAVPVVHNDVDKVILGSIPQWTGAAGSYAASYRIVDILFLPIKSFLQTTYSGFFREGASGVRSATRFAASKARPVFLYAVIVSSVCAVFVPMVVERVMGGSFELMALIIPWLMPILVLKAVHYMAADILTGSGFQSERVKNQVLAAGLNLAMNLAFIPLFSWKAAVAVSLISDALLAVLMVMSVVRQVRSHALLD